MPTWFWIWLALSLVVWIWLWWESRHAPVMLERDDGMIVTELDQWWTSGSDEDEFMALRHGGRTEGKTLILMVGLPRSGKTTIARELSFPIVSPDAIRLCLHGQAYMQGVEDLVWSLARLMVRSLFEAGHHTVIVDAIYAPSSNAWPKPTSP